MINVCDLLFEICEDDRVYDKELDLIDSGILDSFAFIELFSMLEDYNIIIQPTRIDRSKLRTSGKIQELINDSISIK